MLLSPYGGATLSGRLMEQIHPGFGGDALLNKDRIV
jgi:hypothetical protein